MSLSKRIQDLIKERYGNGSELARVTDVSPKTINNIVNNSNSPNHSVVAKILKGIPDLSAEWLVRGEGPMWRDGSGPEVQEPTTTKERGSNWEDLTLKEFIELMQACKEKLKG